MAHEDRKQQLVEAATEVFLRYGFRKTTLDDIAEAAGLQKSSLYHYFANKEELFRATVSHVHAGLFEEYQEALNAGGSVLDDLERMIDLMRERMEKLRPSLLLLFSELRDLMPVMRDYVDDYAERMHTLIGDRLNRAVEEGELRPLPVREIVTIFSLFLSRAFEARELSCHFESVADEPMPYVRVLIEPYFTKESR